MPKKYKEKSKSKTIQDLHPEAFLLAFNIEQFARRYGTTDEELSAAMGGKSVDTLNRRRKKPWEYQYSEIAGIAKLWGLTPGQLTVEPRYIVEAAEI